MKTIYNLKELSYRSTFLVPLLLLIIIVFWSSCENKKYHTNLNLPSEQMYLLQIGIENYCKDLEIPLEGINNLLIIPLSGCEPNIQPFLISLDSSYPCEILEHSLIIFDTDYPKQLEQKTKFNRNILPSCIKFHENAGAYLNGLVQNAPIGYQLKKGRIDKIWNGANKQWLQYLKENYHIKFINLK